MKLMIRMNMDCCGASELVGFNSSDFSTTEFFKALAQTNFYRGNYTSTYGRGMLFGTYAWTKGRYRNSRNPDGERKMKNLVNYINRNKLGQARMTKGFSTNYSNNHVLIGFMWAPDNKAVHAFLQKKRGPTKTARGINKLKW